LCAARISCSVLCEVEVWGAPRIHGELLKLGITVSQATVSRYMPVSHGGQRSQTWRAFLRNQATAIVHNRTFEGHGRIDNIRSWSRVVRHRAAKFSATALAGPPSPRTWYLAHTPSLIAMHQRVRTARDQAPSVASNVAVRRRLVPSARAVDLLMVGSETHQLTHILKSASCFRHRSHGSALCVLCGRTVVAAPLAICHLMCKIADHRIPNRD